MDQGIPGIFIAMFILVPLVGIGATIWRVSTARRIAREAGLDPDNAAATTLLTPNGLDATYLAASLRGAQPEGGHSSFTPTDLSHRSTEDRLRELQDLRDKGLVSQAEYDDRRQGILAEI